jgi:hypothetical protein
MFIIVGRSNDYKIVERKCSDYGNPWNTTYLSFILKSLYYNMDFAKAINSKRFDKKSIEIAKNKMTEFCMSSLRFNESPVINDIFNPIIKYMNDTCIKYVFIEVHNV